MSPDDISSSDSFGLNSATSSASLRHSSSQPMAARSFTWKAELEESGKVSSCCLVLLAEAKRALRLVGCSITAGVMCNGTAKFCLQNGSCVVDAMTQGGEGNSEAALAGLSLFRPY